MNKEQNICQLCNKNFKRKYARGINPAYCSPKCGQRAWYLRTYKKKGRRSWNTGMTKHNNEIVRRIGEATSRRQKGKNPYNKTLHVNRELVKKSRGHTSRTFKKDICCYFCSSKDNLHFHHFVYQFPSTENDFITVCRSCHNKIHKWMPKTLKQQSRAIFEELEDAILNEYSRLLLVKKENFLSIKKKWCG